MNLNTILNDLSKHNTKDRTVMMEECIQKRLTSAIKVYYNELDKSISYLQSRKDIDVMKKINQYDEK